MLFRTKDFCVRSFRVVYRAAPPKPKTRTGSVGLFARTLFKGRLSCGYMTRGCSTIVAIRGLSATREAVDQSRSGEHTL